jgi:hypothetical protein
LAGGNKPHTCLKLWVPSSLLDIVISGFCSVLTLQYLGFNPGCFPHARQVLYHRATSSLDILLKSFLLSHVFIDLSSSQLTEFFLGECTCRHPWIPCSHMTLHIKVQFLLHCSFYPFIYFSRLTMMSKTSSTR